MTRVTQAAKRKARSAAALHKEPIDKFQADRSEYFSSPVCEILREYETWRSNLLGSENDLERELFRDFVRLAVRQLGRDRVAEECCVSKPTIDRWETGEFAPHPLGRPSVYVVLGQALWS